MSPSSIELVRELTEFSPAPGAGCTPCSELHAIVAAVFEDQGELYKTVVRLRDMCAPLARDEPCAEPGPTVLMEELEAELIGHFVVEKAEELYAGLFTEEPRLMERVERLNVERKEIVRAMDELMNLAQGGPPGHELALSLAPFLDWVDLHERAENAVMQDFLLLDPSETRD
jgi:hypothetical protein